MDVNKYRALFLDESREHVSEMSRLLVQLEQSSDRQPLIDEVFRHAHSLKSMAAAMGYEPIATLAHRLEDVVGAVRQRGAEVTAGATDVLLRCVDALSQQIGSIREGTALVGYFELVRELGALAQAITRGTSTDGDTIPAVLRVVLSPTCPTPALRGFLIYRRLHEAVPVRSVIPSVDELKAGKLFGNTLRFVFADAYDPSVVQAVLQAISDIESVAFEKSEPAPTFSAAPADSHRGAEELAVSTVRVRTDLLDDLMDTVGELFIAREQLRVLLKSDARQEVKRGLDGLGTRIRQIHDQVIAARMMPLRTLTDRYPRVVRDLCRSLGKEVELEIQGRDIEIDRAVLDNLDVPLMHVLRNAVDHGIESAVQRVQQGKSAAGKIVISALRERDTVLISVQDDGAGLDANKLRDMAIHRGVITTTDAASLSPREVLFLICLPGFSTKEQVSDISGRGVGMDVVMNRLNSLGGALDIESELGHGTRFFLRLPVTLAIIPALLIKAAERIFAVPVAKVVAVRDATGICLSQPGGALLLPFEDRLLPLAHLRQLLSLGKGPSMPAHVVVVEGTGELFALGVDAIVGYREVVVKSLGDPLDRLEWFAGASILGDGQPILILDLPKTLRLRRSA